jgi:hypothetical protein
MLLLTLIFIGLVILAAVIFLSIQFMITSRHTVNHDTDAQALELARRSNEDNRLGDLLDSTKASREAVFSDRNDCQRTSYPLLRAYAPLSSLLMIESRRGALMLEEEHRRQIESFLGDLREAVWNHNNVHRSKSVFDNVITKVENNRITDVEVGFCKNTPSSVQDSKGVLPDLDTYDSMTKHSDGRDGYFLPVADARLPFDEDLKFTFDSLPPSVNRAVVPARLMHDRMFVSYGKIFDDGIYHHKNLDLLPTALKVTRKVQFKNVFGNKEDVVVASTATAPGAHSPIWERSTRPEVVSGVFIDPGEPGQDWQAALNRK